MSATEPTPWQVLSKRIIHESPWGINVALWSVRLPDGTIARDHLVLEHLRPVVGIVPIADDGRILMIDHYRSQVSAGGSCPPDAWMQVNRSMKPRGASCCGLSLTGLCWALTTGVLVEPD